MKIPLISNGFISEHRLLHFMGAGGPEAHADIPEPVDQQNNTLDHIDQMIDEADRSLDSIDAGVERLEDVLTDRVENLADASVDKASSTVDSTNSYLVSQIEGINDTIHVLIREDKELNRLSKRNVEAQRNVNVTGLDALTLATEGRVLAEMGLRLSQRWGSEHDKMIATGDALDASMEDQEGTGRSETWRKTEGGAPENVQAKEGVGEKEEQVKYEPTASAEKQMGDLVLAMKIANSEATGKVDGPAAFKALSAEFSTMEPAQQDAFVVWANEQIAGRPYEAGKDDLSGTLRFDRTA